MADILPHPTARTLVNARMQPDMPTRHSWCGIIPPLVTPLVDRDEIDQPGTERLIEHVLAGGVSGVFILGTTGEAPSLSYRLRREFVSLVCRLVAGRVPILVGITDTSFIESISLAEHAALAGANALVLSTPYYFPAGQTELIQYVRRITKRLPLPLMLYNMPSLTKVWFEIDSLRQLTDQAEIVGVKDSSGDLEYYRQLVGLKQLRSDWLTFIGPEHLLVESLNMGGNGGVAGGANCFPRLFTELYTSTMRKDSATSNDLTAQVQKLQEIYSVGKYPSRFIKATKAALSILDICSDQMAEPFNHFLPPEKQRVARILEELKRMGAEDNANYSN